MIKICPDHIRTVSQAERDLFKLIKRVRTQEDWICYHSLNVPEHAYKRNGEIDFLFLGPQELFCFEIKGGHVACHDGVWTYTDRYNLAHQSVEGPFKQVQSAMYALRNRIERELFPELESHVLLGYGVVLPETEFAVHGFEWPDEVIFDQQDMSESGMLGYLERLRSYWGAKQQRPPGFSPIARSELEQFLRPSFDLIPSVQARINEIEQRVVSLTADQYRVMDSFSAMPRVLCKGCAGSGKTLLALEEARKRSMAGDEVLFLCASPVLASVIKSRLPDERILVCSVGEFQPRAFARDRQLRLPGWAKTDRVDVLIIDEAQDCLTFSHLDLFETVLRGGLESGRWCIFYDPENQSGVYGAMDFDVVKYLQSFHPGEPVLQYNCRNSKAIVTKTEILTGTFAGHPLVLNDEPVETIWYTDNRDQADLISQLLRRLIEKENIQRGDISVLSMLPAGSSTAFLTGVCKWTKPELLDESALANYPFRSLTISSVRDFKGLDNAIILLTDVNSLTDRTKIYVGLTRARSKLYVFMKRGLEISENELVERFIERKMEQKGN